MDLNESAGASITMLHCVLKPFTCNVSIPYPAAPLVIQLLADAAWESSGKCPMWETWWGSRLLSSLLSFGRRASKWKTSLLSLFPSFTLISL